MPFGGDKVLRRLARAFVMIVQMGRGTFYRLASTGTRVSGQPKRSQPIYCLGKGRIEFGARFQAGYFPAPGFLSTCCHLNPRGETAVISFGDDVVVNNNFTAIAETCRIQIGNRVLIGPSVSVYDSDFHGLQVQDRLNPAAVRRGDVTIGDDVFIGTGVIILKGVTIGAGAIVSAGAIVTKDVPGLTIAAGNPAKVIGTL